MNIITAKFLKGLVGPDEILADGTKQVAFIGRSNVGKSSLINSLTQSKTLAKTSSFPGRTQQINVFLVSIPHSSPSAARPSESRTGKKDFYFVDLPGYGFAKGSKALQEDLQQLIYWYLLNSPYEQKKVVLIIDAVVGPTDNDIKMYHSLEAAGKNIIVVANKIDKLKKSETSKKLKELKETFGNAVLVPYSSEAKLGRNELWNEILK